MKTLLKLILSMAVGVLVFKLLPVGYFLSVAVGVVAFIVTLIVLNNLIERIIDKDALYIRETLRHARRKNKEIQVYGRKLRMWKMWRKIRYIRKINGEIINTIQNNPNRFQQADKFFSLYLDSTLNVLEKYDVLVHQPVRTAGLVDSTRKTEAMIDDLIKGLEQQLTYVLKDDMIELEIENEVLKKHSQDRKAKVEEKEMEVPKKQSQERVDEQENAEETETVTIEVTNTEEEEK